MIMILQYQYFTKDLNIYIYNIYSIVIDIQKIGDLHHTRTIHQVFFSANHQVFLQFGKTLQKNAFWMLQVSYIDH